MEHPPSFSGRVHDVASPGLAASKPPQRLTPGSADVLQLRSRQPWDTWVGAVHALALATGNLAKIVEHDGPDAITVVLPSGRTVAATCERLLFHQSHGSPGRWRVAILEDSAPGAPAPTSCDDDWIVDAMDTLTLELRREGAPASAGSSPETIQRSRMPIAFGASARQKKVSEQP